jgi:hypothetical protein
VKTLEQLGKWRCQGCGGWNGEENEAKRLVEEMRARKERDEKEGWQDVSRGDEEVQEEPADEDQESEEKVSEGPVEAENETGETDEEQGDEVEDEGSEEGPTTRSKAKDKNRRKKA